MLLMSYLRIALLAAMAATTAPADDPVRTYEGLFGEEARRVRATPTPQDDVEFAKKLLQAARNVPGDRALQAVLYMRACESAAVHPDGYAVVAEALGAIAREQPHLQEAAEDRVRAVLEKQYRTATGATRGQVGAALLAALLRGADVKASAGRYDEATAMLRQAQQVAAAVDPDAAPGIVERLRRVTARQALARKAEDLKALLERKPDNARVAADLVWLLLVELDDRAEAAKYARLTADAALKRAAELAAKDTAALGADEALELGEWYRAQSGKASEQSRRSVLMRARECYDRFVAAHPQADARRLKAQIASDELAAAIARLGGSGRSPRAINLLALVDPVRDRVKGQWRFEPAGLVCDNDLQARLRIPYQPPEEYDFYIEFTRLDGQFAVAQMLARGDKQFAWLMDEGKQMVCQLFVPPRGNREDIITVEGGPFLQNGRRHSSLVRVRNNGVATFLDGRPMCRYATDYANVWLHQSWMIPEHCLGVGAYNSRVVFHVIEVVEVSGRGRVLAPRQ